MITKSIGECCKIIFLVLLPISWEKGAKCSRVQGFKCLILNYFIIRFMFLKYINIILDILKYNILTRPGPNLISSSFQGEIRRGSRKINVGA